MPTVVRSPFTAVLAAVKAQLTAVTGLPAFRVKAVMHGRRFPHFQADQDILVVIGPPVPDNPVTYGAGRVDFPVVRTLTVTPRVRMASDPSDSDDLLISDPARGLIALEEAVLNALHDFHPTDANNNLLTREPIHFSPSPPPSDDPPPDRTWASSPLNFEVAYVVAVDQAQPQ
jgi:hypothetical protein